MHTRPLAALPADLHTRPLAAEPAT